MYEKNIDHLTPVGILMIEHRLIERGLNVLEARIRAPSVKPDVIAFAELLDFFASYADATHHGKEEDMLFVEAERMRLPDDLARTLAELRGEHQQSRALRRTMAEANRKMAAGDMKAIEQFIPSAKQVVTLYRAHIPKEDNVFFPGFDKLQSNEQKIALKRRFMEFDMDIVHRTYRSVIERNELTSGIKASVAV